MKTYTLLALLMSTFYCLNSSAKTHTTSIEAESIVIQRVRIDFETPNGYVRHLLLGFTSDNAATDGFDYGYDGLNVDDFEDDLNWIINDDRYVIQGVGQFDVTKQYPLGMFLTNSGEIKISLESLENFETQIDVFIYDSELDTYAFISEIEFSKYMSSGDYLDRFYIAFMNHHESDENGGGLSVTESVFDTAEITYYSNSSELFVKINKNEEFIREVILYNSIGQKVQTITNSMQVSQLRIPVSYISDNQLIVRVKTRKKSYDKLLVIY